MLHFHLLAVTFSFPSFHLVKQPIFVQNGTSGRNVEKKCGGTSVNINLLPINHLQLLQPLRLTSKRSHCPVFIISADRWKELRVWRGSCTWMIYCQKSSVCLFIHFSCQRSGTAALLQQGSTDVTIKEAIFATKSHITTCIVGELLGEIKITQPIEGYKSL